MLKSAVVLFNPKKKEGARIKKDVEKFLIRHGVKLSKEGEIVIAIGGDGTILYNKYCGKPMFGIGSALSFLCEATMKNWKGALGKVLKGYDIDRRVMLSAKLDGKKLPDALNEVCVRRREHRIATINLRVGGKRYRFRADGVIISTPTGSTAYAYSCGGEELPPHSKKYEIVAIAPLRRELKPLIVDEKEISDIFVEGGEYTDVIIDGQLVFPLKKRSRLKIYKGDKTVDFVKAK